MNKENMQILAKIELLKLQSIVNTLNKLYEAKKQLENSSIYTISFNSRVNTYKSSDSYQEKLVLKLDEIIRSIEKHENEAKKYINKIHKTEDGVILFYIYFRLYSYSKLAKHLSINKTQVFRRHKQALINYYLINMN